jgi:hypothetical protein
MARIHLYTIAPNGKSFTCHLCGWTHFSPQDVDARYCDKCQVYLDDVRLAEQMARDLGILRDEPTDRLAFFRRVVSRLCGIGRPTASS